MSETLEIPLFPLSTVLFPAGRLPLRIFEPRYVAMTRSCLRDSTTFGVALIRGGFEVGRPAIPYEVGCTVRIVECRETAPNRFALLAQGETVFRILERRIAEDGLLVGRVELREPPDPTPVPPRHAALAAMLKRAVERFSAGSFPQPYRLEDAAWVGNRLAEILPMTPERKQRLLELRDPLAVLDEIARLLQDMGGSEAGTA
jgi:Lon protease-like protein